MKSILKSAAIVAAVVMGISSCTTEKDPCETVVCQNGGQAKATGDVCSCDCSVGYEGNNCETEVRTKYLGASTGQEACTSGSSIITITNAGQPADVTKVTIQNLYDANFVTNGTVQADGTINIPTQSFGTASISGSVSVNSAGKIVATYVITAAGGASDNCTWTQN